MSNPGSDSTQFKTICMLEIKFPLRVIQQCLKRNVYTCFKWLHSRERRDVIIFQIPEKDFEVQILHTFSSLHELCAVGRLLVLESFTNVARHRQWKSKGKISSNSMFGCVLHQQMQTLITSIFRFIV